MQILLRDIGKFASGRGRLKRRHRSRKLVELKGQDAKQGTSSSPIVQSVRIFGFHPEDPGSIPGGGVTFAFFDNLQLFNILAALIIRQRLLT